MGWGERWEGGSGWGTHVNPWPIHVNVWQKPLQYCKVISLQLIKINGKKKKKKGQGLPGSTVDEDLPANTGDMDLIPGPGRFHMPRSD